MSGQYKKYVRERLSPFIRWVTYPPAIWLIRLFRSEAAMFTTQNGNTFTLKMPPVNPGKNPLRYHGKVCFLVGSGTYSSAMLLADAVKHNEIAALIGEETGGIPSHFGEIYVFDLPNSLLGVIVSTAKFIRADGDQENRNGVLPHIIVKSGFNPDEGDTVLEAAKEWILNTEYP
jgi:C-terminal processing protease CtpA/Prc